MKITRPSIAPSGPARGSSCISPDWISASYPPTRVSGRFFTERTAPLHLTDCVGTYGSLHFAEKI